GLCERRVGANRRTESGVRARAWARRSSVDTNAPRPERSAEVSRSRRHAEPPRDLQLPAEVGGRRAGLRREDPGASAASRVPKDDGRTIALFAGTLIGGLIQPERAHRRN